MLDTPVSRKSVESRFAPKMALIAPTPTGKRLWVAAARALAA
jgi:hypothetical protein